MAIRLVQAGLEVTGYDIVEEPMAKLRRAGGRSACNPAEAAADAELLIIVVVNSDQAEQVLFGPSGAVEALSEAATVMLCSTVPAESVRGVHLRLREKGIALLDAPKGLFAEHVDSMEPPFALTMIRRLVPEKPGG